MGYYLNSTMAFVVYAHGTAVVCGTSLPANLDACNVLLLDAVQRSPDFTVTPMCDDDFQVRFRGPVFGLVSGELLRRKGRQLLSDALEHGLFPSEALLPATMRAVSDEHYAIGLYARAKLYMDAESQIVCEEFTPRL